LRATGLLLLGSVPHVFEALEIAVLRPESATEGSGCCKDDAVRERKLPLHADLAGVDCQAQVQVDDGSFLLSLSRGTEVSMPLAKPRMALMSGTGISSMRFS
jgi:hypothetical protein